MSRRVRLQPIGEEISCDPEETVLDAAFRHGYNLAYGCREGQCSACKCYVLHGEFALRPYSSFALSDAERGNGYALMCRAMPESDLEIELLHHDPENFRLENAIRSGIATVNELAQLTHDIVGLTLRVDEPEDFSWLPGQYIDIHIPGSDDARRSFSIASLPQDCRIELMIKRYPGGRLSALLGTEIHPGSSLRFTGPYGTFHLRRSERPILMIAGGSGMAPLLGVLRQLAGEGCTRPIRFLYGARSERDLFMLDEIASLGEHCGDFRFLPVVGGHVHEAVDDELTDPDVYMCGPPPMLEAAEAMLTRRGIDPARIFQDRFTTAAEAVSAAPDPAAARSSERAFAWFTPAGRQATLYEDVTVDTQPSVHRHLTRGWPLRFADGRGMWDDASTVLRCEDWFAFRDPGQHWERTFYQRAAGVEQGLEAAVTSAAEQGLFEDFTPQWRRSLQGGLQIAAFVEHGLWFALATAARDCLSDTVATCVCLQAALKQRSAQAIVLYAMDLERHLGIDLAIEPARDALLHHEAWQPTRRYLERLAATGDWGEVIIAANLCFEPVVGTMLRRELGTRAAAAGGDLVTPMLARAAMQEWEWTRAWTMALVRFLGARNEEIIRRWVARWTPLAVGAAAAIDPAAAQRASAYGERMIAESLQAAPVCDPPARALAGAGAGAASPALRGAPRRSDYVGIVMARSAEGDAVARFFAGRAEVIEQPAFWEIRAQDRLVIPYDEVSAQLGYEIGAYSIQHEMSTHYGRMVATDEALMLFADPAEAMEHLLS